MKPWTPFQRATLPPRPHVHPILKPDTEVYLNSRYQVNVRRFETPGFGCGRMVELSIKTLEKDARHDWRDFQAIKNALVGPECEAVELYPAESRLVDTANQFFVFAIPEPGVRFPFGFPGRLVAGPDAQPEVGAVQRPFEPHVLPPDLVAKERELRETYDRLTWRERLEKDRTS